jgi:hypothetical protein
MVLVLAGLLIVVLFLLLNRGGGGAASPLLQGPNENRGNVVARVNGAPIYEQDYLERSEFDKQTFLNDPLFVALIGSFETFTGTRALDTIKQDALDRLINFEVLNQQAKKEGLYPSEEQLRTIIADARQREVPAGQTFEQFLAEYNINEWQYNRRVIRNLVYTVMADAHMPKTGTAEERRNAYFQYICETRKSYTVEKLLTFTTTNPDCSSDLPPEIPLPGLEEATEVVPEPISTPEGGEPQGPPAP